MRHEDTARDLVTFAQRPGITEFNGMAVPILALRTMGSILSLSSRFESVEAKAEA